MFHKKLLLSMFAWLCCLITTAYPQEEQQTETKETPATIVLQTGKSTPPAFLYSASVTSTATVDSSSVKQSLKLEIRAVQGKWGSVSLGLAGVGEITNVIGGGITSWAVRVSGEERFLDLQIQTEAKEIFAEVIAVSPIASLPSTIDLLHMKPSKALGFDSRVKIDFDRSITGKVLVADGFSPLVSQERSVELQSTKGGRISLQVDRSSALPPPIELVQCSVNGALQPEGDSILFSLRGEARVNREKSTLRILAGNVALNKLPENDNYTLDLVQTDAGPTYVLNFAKSGTFPIEIEFASKPIAVEANGREVNFQVAGGAVVPLTLTGFANEIAFAKESQFAAPELFGNEWKGFLPASGLVKLKWQPKQERSETKTFFSTSSTIEATVGSGLVRQNHKFLVEILQGQLKSLQFALSGAGEITSVEGQHIVSWKVVASDDQRMLEVTLNQPLTSKHELVVRSQTTLDAFPVRVDGMCVKPQGAIRNAGFLRISNSGSVKFEATDLKGLTQLAAEQFPGEAIQARQSYAYRFPTSDYSFVIAADRVQPEINVSHVAVYSVTETDRMVSADIELDIRETSIREWSFQVPENYTIVAVSGASVADYNASSDAIEGKRSLKVLFSQDVMGRQLLSVRLEKSETQVTGEWQLPRIEFPDAKSVRGDIGIVASAGFRTTTKASELLVEKPLAYFPVSIPLLQQAFRIREPLWSATVTIEQLDRSLNADVFHLYSLSQGTVYGSSLINFMVSGSPVSEWRIRVPETLQNLTVDGKDVRNWRREGDVIVVSLHQPILGAYTLLITFEEKPNVVDGTFAAGVVVPEGTQNDRGYIEVVSPIQVDVQNVVASSQLLALDALELPAEFRLLSSAPSLGTWQYTARPFDLRLKVNWYPSGTTVDQVVEFSEANSRVSSDGETVTDVVYYVKSRGQSSLRLQLPSEPVRLWSVSINGKPVTARQTESETLIPLPGDADPNVPLEVTIRLGKPTQDEHRASLSLPKVMAPVLKTRWTIGGEENQTLVPIAQELSSSIDNSKLDGFRWVVREGVVPFMVFVVLVLLAYVLPSTGLGKLSLKLIALAGALVVAIMACDHAYHKIAVKEPIQLNVPVLATGESLSMDVDIIPNWRAMFDILGVGLGIVGLLLVVVTFVNAANREQASLLVRFLRGIGFALLGVGALLQPHGAVWFFGVLAGAVMLFLTIPVLITMFKTLPPSDRQKVSEAASEGGALNGVASSAIAFVMSSSFLLGLGNSSMGQDQTIEARVVAKNADYSSQVWEVKKAESRLTATATIKVTGVPGDQFQLLRSPAVLTEFSGPGLRLGKQVSDGGGTDYVVTIEADSKGTGADAAKQYSATFRFELTGLQPTNGVEVLTGPAAMRELTLRYDEPTWEVYCEAAARISKENAADGEAYRLLLKPGAASVVLRPRARDLKSEVTQFYVDGSGLYTISPGVIEGIHRFHMRVSQGRLPRLLITIPEGATVSSVDGPITSWQFNADDRKLTVATDPNAPADFSVTVQTQQSLDALPTSVQLSPLVVEESSGSSGLIAIAFGSDAQPELVTSETLSLVNLGDFDASLLTNPTATLHRVYRYGESMGNMQVKVAAVAPEVRVTSKQIVSLGDERVVLNANLQVEITRTGLFQLSFPLPNGYEVETLTGDSMHHWSEIAQGDSRQVILHLKAKTIGVQTFTLSLTGPSPIDQNQWEIPRLELNDSPRQTGTLIVQPSPGIRLRTITKNNVSESDARALGAQVQGALAFRLLQRDWQLTVGIEKLSPWVIGQILHDITIREGQTRSILFANLNVQNAPIRSMRLKLPVVGDEEVKTVRASGEVVGDMVRVDANEQLWEINFKRRVIGAISFQIDFERRGERVENKELLTPASFLDVQQSDYHVAVRAGGRLEIATNVLPQGWQTVDWNTVPNSMRDLGSRAVPTLTFKVVDTTTPLSLSIVRHSLAESLKLRVASGELTTIFSPNGDQLTSVDITMQVIQRSSLIVQLPKDGELFNIFVNGESVHSVRQTADQNVWQFTILPGMDDSTAKVRYVYALRGDGLKRVRLDSPQMNVPLENIQWNVVVPQGIELADFDGNLELTGEEYRNDYTRDSYLKEVSGSRQNQAQQAATLLEQANQLLQTGNQTKARWAFNNVANSYGLDAASNEDARVQLENLQTQQAVLGLNSRRQRLLLDTTQGAAKLPSSEQMLQAAANNPILKQDDTNFNPNDLSMLLAGNTQEDNATLQSIADRLVQHQRTTDPAPRAIVISLPEEGNVYRFKRSVQVSQGAPLSLDLSFRTLDRLRVWEWLILGTGLLMTCCWFLIRKQK
ncbi:MAG: hypothetical protein ACK5YR_09830 [Pirellula sp.]|jgi:hypothetical protein